MRAPTPSELRALSLEELEHLAEDIRQAILSACLKNGGHLGASLGAVELAIALHRTFESPREPLIWDVGHQAYAHKLLTGRWERFETLRQEGGISGFLSRDESKHDVFGAGHSSTALSVTLAMAVARRRTSDWSVAIVGDGGLTAGIAFEALNNVRTTDLGPMLVLLNDNQMSISANVGALSTILSGNQVREFFELLGFNYVGPIDGHDLRALISTIEQIKSGEHDRPVILHAFTQKGKGYAPAEEQPAAFHGVNPLQEKIPDKPQTKQKTYSHAFGEAMIELAELDPRVVAITAAMPEGTGLSEFARRFPDRFFDVGIAEPHAAVFAAGLATQGLRPIVAIYSTFLQRAFDAIIHDVALQKLPVIFALDRAGLVGADGPTHHGVFDLAYLSMVPGMTVTAPSCLTDVKELLSAALNGDTPFSLRYPRGGGPLTLDPVPDNGVRIHRRPATPKRVVIAVGAMAARAEEAAPQDALVISLTKVKPIPENLLLELKDRRDLPLIVVEAGSIRGGFGEAFVSTMGGWGGKLDLAGIPDEFVPHGTPASLDEKTGLSLLALQTRIANLTKS